MIKLFLKKFWKPIVFIVVILINIIAIGISCNRSNKLKTENKILKEKIASYAGKDSLITRLAEMEGINLTIKVDVKATNVMGKLSVSDIQPTLESILTYSKKEMLNLKDSIK